MQGLDGSRPGDATIGGARSVICGDDPYSLFLRLLIDLIVVDSVFVGSPDRCPCSLSGIKRHMPRYYPYTAIKFQGGSSVAVAQLYLLRAREERETVCFDHCYGVMSVC